MIFCVAALKGGRLASGSENGRIRLWNLADGKLLAKLEGHTAGVLCLAELAGDRLASGGSLAELSYGTSRTFRSSPVLKGTGILSDAWSRSTVVCSRRAVVT